MTKTLFAYHARPEAEYPHLFEARWLNVTQYAEALAWIEGRAGKGHYLHYLTNDETFQWSLPWYDHQGGVVGMRDDDLAMEFRLRWC